MAELLNREKVSPYVGTFRRRMQLVCDNCIRTCGSPWPEETRYSFNVLGGDSGKTMELYFGRPIVWSHNGEVPEYLTLMGGLLVN